MGTVAPDFETQGGLDERFASALGRPRRRNNAPLIDERTATQRKAAMSATAVMFTGRKLK